MPLNNATIGREAPVIPNSISYKADVSLVFDADDVDYLVRRFTIQELNNELHTAEIDLMVAQMDNGLSGIGYYQDYIETVELAIEVSHWFHHNKAFRPPHDPYSPKKGGYRRWQ